MCKKTSVSLQVANAQPTEQPRKWNIQNLAPNEVCIDGDVFDLESFNHPGGESIKVFGGNDVTVLYKMIHFRHGSGRHLKKMKKVGRVDGYKCEYSFDSDFGAEIKREVFGIVKQGKEYGTVGYFSRTGVYIALFLFLTYKWISETPSIYSAILYGVSQALIGLNVQHDANHGAASKKNWINDLLGHGADFIGGCKWLWIQKHWTHHAYTNHAEKDPDAFAAEPFLIFRDYPNDHPARCWYHKFQSLLFLPVVAGYWLSSVVSLEVARLQDSGAVSATMKFENDFVKRQRKFAVLLRLLHLSVTFGSPMFYLGLSLEALLTALLVGISGSVFLGCLFSLSHNFVGADRDPTAVMTETVEPSGQSVCWYKAQVETSCTYGGFISGALTGGLNFQVEHHLFPKMNSAWYPFIAPTVRRVCAKHNVNYTYYPWVWQNAASLIKYLNSAGAVTSEKKLK